MKSVPGWLLPVAAAVLAGAGGWWLGHRSAPVAVPAEVVARLEQSNQTAQQRVQQLEKETQDLQAQLRAQGIEPIRRGPSAARKPVDDTARLETIRQLAQVQARLNAASASLTEVQNRAHELEATIEKITAENKRLTSEGAEMQDTFAASKRLIAALEAEMKSKTDRVTQLELAARKAREEGTTAQQRLTQWTAATRELEDLNRRREAHINALQRKYRDLTDQYRALAVSSETQRDNPGAFTTDVSRIQSVIQSAEDDLRQLISLNSQAQRAAQKLAIK